MSLRLRVLLSVSILIVLLIALNFNYISARLTFWRNKPPIIQEQTPINNQVKDIPNIVSVPSLNISAPLLYVDQNNEGLFQKALQNGVVHFPGTALPGKPGNCYIFGHSSDFPLTPGNYKTVFASLPKIKMGEIIKVTDSEGVVYSYKVVETKIVLPNDTSVLDQGDKTRSLLSLQTSYPLGTALKRFVVIAELQKNSP